MKVEGTNMLAAIAEVGGKGRSGRLVGELKNSSEAASARFVVGEESQRWPIA